jgi:hypothetical protein
MHQYYGFNAVTNQQNKFNQTIGNVFFATAMGDLNSHNEPGM